MPGLPRLTIWSPANLFMVWERHTFEMFGRNNPVPAGNPNIRAAVIDTFELGHVYRRPGIRFWEQLSFEV